MAAGNAMPPAGSISAISPPPRSVSSVRVSLIVTTAQRTVFGDSHRCWTVDWLIIRLGGSAKSQQFQVINTRYNKWWRFACLCDPAHFVFGRPGKCKLRSSKLPPRNSAICNLQSIRKLSRRSCVVATSAMLLMIFLQSARPARADVFELAGGGRLEGKLVGWADKSIYTIDLAAGGRLTIPRSQITKIDSISDTEAEYHKLARTSPDTVESACEARRVVPRAQIDRRSPPDSSSGFWSWIRTTQPPAPPWVFIRRTANG